MNEIEVGIVFIDHNFFVQYYTKNATDIFDLVPSDINRSIEHISHNLDYDSLMDDLAYVVDSLADIKKTVYNSKEDRWYIIRQLPYLSFENKIEGVIITFTEITELKKTEEKLEWHRHQESLATLGMYALEYPDLESIMNRAIQHICLLLEVDYGMVLTLDQKKNKLYLKSYAGWKPEFEIERGIENDKKWDVGYALRAKESLIVTNYRKEDRFSISPFLDDLGIVSGVNIKIAGSEETHGILAIYLKESREFSKYELNFVQIVANLIGMSIERGEAKKRLEEKNAQLEKEIQKSRQYQREILNNSLVERWEIGSFLHDNLAQMLASAKITLADIEKKLPDSRTDIQKEITELHRHIDESLSSIRDLTHGIIPVDIEKEGLEHAFRFLMKHSQKLHNINCKLHIDGFIDKIKDRTVATNLYHVIQEAIRNAAIHGKAKNIEITTKQTNGFFLLQIKDDGVGLSNVPKFKSGKGIRIMNYRMELLGGTFNIEDISNSGKSGTIVTCTLPL